MAKPRKNKQALTAFALDKESVEAIAYLKENNINFSSLMRELLKAKVAEMKGK